MSETSTEGLRIRRAVRALILDPSHRVLLVRFEFPQHTVWALPGGGAEEDETDEQALRRELDEELGLVDVEVGPHIWNRTHVFPFESGLWDGQQDRVHLINCVAFDPTPRFTWEELRAEHLHEIRWWTVDELRAVGDEPRLVFAPRRLPELCAGLLVDGAPTTPIDTGV